MSRDLPRAFSTNSESPLAPSKQAADRPNSRHLSVLSGANGRLTRGQVAARLNVSVSTVRRLEGDRLHPTVDEGDVRWFDEKEVAALAAAMVNDGKQVTKARPGAPPEQRPAGEIAALAFERFEQRQSLAEIVIGLRVEPEKVRALFDQWCLGLTEHQLRSREPNLPRRGEVPRAKPEALAERLAQLPHGELTRISVARFRGDFLHGDAEYLEVYELGGFHVSGSCAIDEITRRYGPGEYRVTAYGLDPPALRWEVVVGL
jgi:hypothetical protein